MKRTRQDPPERIDLEEGLKRLERAELSQPILSFFSSVLGGITTERALFTVPLDDHMVHRGHAVFDTCTVKAGKAYGLSFHLDRFLLSASKCSIVPYCDKEGLRSIILHTIAAAKRNDFVYVRYWMSAGRGDFNVYPSANTKANFYCAVHCLSPSPSSLDCVAEASVSVPLKSTFLATIKTTNYLVNALAAMEGRARGGTYGLQLDAKGCVAETAVGAVGFVFEDGKTLHVPKLDQILKSTTLIRAAELLKAKEGGEVVFEDILLVDALRRATEVIGFGGGRVTAIVRLDGKTIGSGNEGPVFRKLRDWIKEDEVSGEFLDDVPFEDESL